MFVYVVHVLKINKWMTLLYFAQQFFWLQISVPLFLLNSLLVNSSCVATFPELQPERKVEAGTGKFNVIEGVMASDR